MGLSLHTRQNVYATIVSLSVAFVPLASPLLCIKHTARTPFQRNIENSWWKDNPVPALKIHAEF